MISFVAFIIGVLCCSISFTTTHAFQSNILSINLNTQLYAQTQKAAGTYGIDVPYEEANYNPQAAEQFYKNKRIESLSRTLQIVSKSSGFISNTMLDAKLNREDELVDQRSDELLPLVSELGPTFIKIGQALSTRTDLLPAKYAKGLVGLQDAVPPFSAELGRQVIEDELNIKIDDVFSELSMQPVASASIGQVYKGKLRSTGEYVAVKVQRPAVLSSVAMDLHMLRTLAPMYQKNKDINTDLVGLVDAWLRT